MFDENTLETYNQLNSVEHLNYIEARPKGCYCSDYDSCEFCGDLIDIRQALRQVGDWAWNLSPKECAQEAKENGWTKKQIKMLMFENGFSENLVKQVIFELDY